MDEQLISFVMRSKNRKIVLALLESKPMIPAQIMKETGIYKSHTSRALKELTEKGLVFCKNPNDRAYRFYALTAKGKRILKDANFLL
ncbi:MAG: MarR family transcriptional regulator [Nanoarchaeota archaeon]|nr:MarR family transcriptional regulator [Nanoarchaeota archaeon]